MVRIWMMDDVHPNFLKSFEYGNSKHWDFRQIATLITGLSGLFADGLIQQLFM